MGRSFACLVPLDRGHCHSPEIDAATIEASEAPLVLCQGGKAYRPLVGKVAITISTHVVFFDVMYTCLWPWRILVFCLGIQERYVYR
jgi:hypothetical protein